MSKRKPYLDNVHEEHPTSLWNRIINKIFHLVFWIESTFFDTITKIKNWLKAMRFKTVAGQNFEEAARVKSVENDAETWDYTPNQYYRPKNLKGVIEAIQFARDKGYKVRSIGSKHSYSEVIAIGKASNDTWDVSEKYKSSNKVVGRDGVPGVYIDLTQTIDAIGDQYAVMYKESQAPIDNLKTREHKHRYFNVLNGWKVSMVNHLLCNESYDQPDKPNNINPKKINPNEDFSKVDWNSDAAIGKRSLFNTGGGAIQRFAGAFSTGTHGSGGFLSTYHDTIRSILLVDSDGAVHRIEPNDGITDKDTHDAFYADKEIKVNLIQDDDKFYSVIVSMGCIGLIYSVIIEVMPVTRLYEQGYLGTKDFKPEYATWSIETAKHHVKDIKARYAKMFKAYDNLKDATLQGVHDIQKELLFDYFYVNPYTAKGQDYPSYAQKTNTYTQKPSAGKYAHRKIWPTLIGELDLTAALAKLIFNWGDYPKVKLIESALKTLRDNANTKDEGYVDLSYNVWNQGTGSLATVGASIEYAIPIDEFPEVFQGVLGELAKLAKEGEVTDKGLYLDGPIALRFVRAGEGHLAPNCKYYKKDGQLKETPIWVYIELITVPGGGKKHRKNQLELYTRLQEYLTEHGCRPHWGLNMGYKFNKELLAKMYPKFDTWLATYKFFNKDGRFDNQLTMNAKFREDTYA